MRWKQGRRLDADWSWLDDRGGSHLEKTKLSDAVVGRASGLQALFTAAEESR